MVNFHAEGVAEPRLQFRYRRCLADDDLPFHWSRAPLRIAQRGSKAKWVHFELQLLVLRLLHDAARYLRRSPVPRMKCNPYARGNHLKGQAKAAVAISGICVGNVEDIRAHLHAPRNVYRTPAWARADSSPSCASAFRYEYGQGWLGGANGRRQLDFGAPSETVQTASMAATKHKAVCSILFHIRHT